MTFTLIFGTLLCIILCYLIGSFPSAYLVVKLFTGKNILDHGTGNVGTMNTHRTTNNKWLTVLVLVLDMLKGSLAFWLSIWFSRFANISPDLVWDDRFLIAAGLAVILGHNYSIYLKFKGGKGLATGAGFFIWLNPLLVLAWCLIFLFVVGISKYMVLGQIVASAMLPLIAWIINPLLFPVTMVMSIAVVYRHWPRLAHVLDGTEPKMYYKVRNTQEK